jgi:hypothetical protein
MILNMLRVYGRCSSRLKSTDATACLRVTPSAVAEQLALTQCPFWQSPWLLLTDDLFLHLLVCVVAGTMSAVGEQQAPMHKVDDTKHGGVLHALDHQKVSWFHIKAVIVAGESLQLMLQHYTSLVLCFLCSTAASSISA